MAAFSTNINSSCNALSAVVPRCCASARTLQISAHNFVTRGCAPGQLLGVRAQHRQHTTPDAASYTSMNADPSHFWNSHKGLSHPHPTTTPSLIRDEFAFNEAHAPQDLFLAAELRLLANAASDRAQMHNILAHQRDNWNKLFQLTITTACVTACVLSGLDGQAHSLSLTVPALLLNSGSAIMMAMVNLFQPSQLAEEQRSAERLLHKLSRHIHYALHTAPPLRQHAPSLLRDCKRRLQALDKAFPMPLTPGGLEKFPAKVIPPVLIEPNDTDPRDPLPSTDASSDITNGWDEQLTGELQQVASLLRRFDIPKYTGWAQNLVTVNKSLALAAPILAASAALLNATALTMSPTSSTSTVGMWAASCSVMAVFAGSILHDMQLGMVFELYRNSAGYYADVEADINEALCEPVELRENGILFRQRIAYKLGRWPSLSVSSTPASNGYSASSSASPSMVPADAQEAAGTLF